MLQTQRSTTDSPNAVTAILNFQRRQYYPLFSLFFFSLLKNESFYKDFNFYLKFRQICIQSVISTLHKKKYKNESLYNLSVTSVYEVSICIQDVVCKSAFFYIFIRFVFTVYRFQLVSKSACQKEIQTNWKRKRWVQ